MESSFMASHFRKRKICSVLLNKSIFLNCDPWNTSTFCSFKWCHSHFQHFLPDFHFLVNSRILKELYPEVTLPQGGVTLMAVPSPSHKQQLHTTLTSVGERKGCKGTQRLNKSWSTGLPPLFAVGTAHLPWISLFLQHPPVAGGQGSPPWLSSTNSLIVPAQTLWLFAGTKH